jgi:hypothetical protein
MSGGKTHRNETLHPARIADHDGGLRGHSFYDCAISGPVVIAVELQSTIIQDSIVELDHEHPEKGLWILPDDQYIFMGAVGLMDCRFERCRFQGNVGFAGDEADLQTLVQALMSNEGPGSWAPPSPRPNRAARRAVQRKH